ncbi:hypothetical protein EXE53_17545 [Halorubrum sp. SD626R]|nr:hypothetical protein EXE53_17545 [Halorubrum sp. SD626R]
MDLIVAFLALDVCDSRRRIKIAVFEIDHTSRLGFPEESGPGIAQLEMILRRQVVFPLVIPCLENKATTWGLVCSLAVVW